MKNIILLVAALLISTSASAEPSCRDKIGAGNDSNTVSVLADFEEGVTAEVQTLILLQRAAKKVGCQVDDFKLNLETLSCKNIVPKKDASKVCYVEAGIGYFFVMKDYVDGGNVVFNRWD